MVLTTYLTVLEQSSLQTVITLLALKLSSFEPFFVGANGSITHTKAEGNLTGLSILSEEGIQTTEAHVVSDEVFYHLSGFNT
jgi:hypothetical protein